MLHKKHIKILLVYCLLCANLTLTSSVIAQDPVKPIPLPTGDKVLEAVRNSVVHVGNGKFLWFSNQDITAFMNGRSSDPSLKVRETVATYFNHRTTNPVVQDPLQGDAEVWIRADTNIEGRGASFLVQNTTHVKKLEAWSTSLDINGSVNSSGNLNILYTSSAYTKVYSNSMQGWSGCVLINTGGTKRYATMYTYHRQYKTQVTPPVIQREFGNRVTVRWSCIGE